MKDPKSRCICTGESLRNHHAHHGDAPAARHRIRPPQPRGRMDSRGDRHVGAVGRRCYSRGLPRRFCATVASLVCARVAVLVVSLFSISSKCFRSWFELSNAPHAP